MGGIGHWYSLPAYLYDHCGPVLEPTGWLVSDAEEVPLTTSAGVLRRRYLELATDHCVCGLELQLATDVVGSPTSLRGVLSPLDVALSGVVERRLLAVGAQQLLVGNQRRIGGSLGCWQIYRWRGDPDGSWRDAFAAWNVSPIAGPRSDDALGILHASGVLFELYGGTVVDPLDATTVSYVALQIYRTKGTRDREVAAMAEAVHDRALAAGALPMCIDGWVGRSARRLAGAVKRSSVTPV